MNPRATLLAVAHRRAFALADAPLLAITLLTPLVLLVHGYHPYADDAGIYVAGVKKMIDPSLFATDAIFVLPHTHLSVFSHLLAGMVRWLHLPLEPTLFLAHLLSIFAFLLASWQIACRVFASTAARWGAVLLAAAAFTLPVTGTALAIMDPYLTARSFSTPFALFAVAAVLDRSWKRAGLWIALAGCMHPLMAIYALGFVLMLALVEMGRMRLALALCAAALLGCAAVFLRDYAQPVETGYLVAILSRHYLFLSSWQWYEVVGLLAPLALLGLAVPATGSRSATSHLCLASLLVGGTALLGAICFVHVSHPNFLASLQILRSFHMVYCVGVLLLGGLVGRFLGARSPWWGAVFFPLVAAILLFSQMQIYPASQHVEWPGTRPQNPWQKAFLWIRASTPHDAIFALDPSYQAAASEDTQGFRATAERSSLGDNAKDGGVVAIFPKLGPEWNRQRLALLGLEQESDAMRRERLAPFHVSWLVLSAETPTALPCPYRNEMVAVCRLAP